MTEGSHGHEVFETGVTTTCESAGDAVRALREVMLEDDGVGK